MAVATRSGTRHHPRRTASRAVVRWMRAATAVVLYQLVSALPARLVPHVLLPYRYKFRAVWISPHGINRKHGPPGESQAAGRALNAALRRKFVVDGPWDYPGRPLGAVHDTDELVLSMRENGFTRHSLLKEAVRGGIQICIARDGRPVLFNEGHNRVTAAKIAGISAVPVLIRGVHRLWAEKTLARHGDRLVTALDRGIAELETEE